MPRFLTSTINEERGRPPYTGFARIHFLFILSRGVTGAGSATAGSYAPPMHHSHGHRDFRAAPTPSGWLQTGERWALWYDGRETASVTPDGGPGGRLWMEGQKFWEVKEGAPPMSGRQSVTASAGARACCIPACLYVRPLLGWAITRRSSWHRHHLACRRRGSSSNRPGAWPRPERRRSSGSR